MILSGETIRELGIIEPCEPRTKMKGMTYGLSMAGYDFRVEFDSDGLRQNLVIPVGWFVLVSTIEKVRIPNNVMGIVHDKSSWARRGIAVQNTVLEPGWRGHVTLEISNHSHETITLIRGMAIAQVVFHYIDRNVKGYDGKYQDQGRGPVEAIHEK